MNRNVLAALVFGGALVQSGCGSDDGGGTKSKTDAGTDSGSTGGFGGFAGGSGGATGGSGGSTGGSGGVSGASGGSDAGLDGSAGASGGSDAGLDGSAGASSGGDAGIDANGGTDAGFDASADANGGTDAGFDASADANGGTDAGFDASADASGGSDAGLDGGAGADGGDAGGADSGANAIESQFDETPGANTYLGGLQASNWVGASFHAPNAGSQLFATGNGNSTGTFPNIGITKNLGGKVENKTYAVSFYVVQPDAGQTGIELSDFSRLRIGGPNGTVSWTSTPVPPGPGQWVQWKGTYTPDSSDVGGPFLFDAQFNLDAKHSIGIDGPVVATPL
ncbi:MAG: hypothetical protein R3B13_34390 [Polyangiaceae bacterium]